MPMAKDVIKHRIKIYKIFLFFGISSDLNTVITTKLSLL